MYTCMILLCVIYNVLRTIGVFAMNRNMTITYIATKLITAFTVIKCHLYIYMGIPGVKCLASRQMA